MGLPGSLHGAPLHKERYVQTSLDAGVSLEIKEIEEKCKFETLLRKVECVVKGILQNDPEVVAKTSKGHDFNSEYLSFKVANILIFSLF